MESFGALLSPESIKAEILIVDNGSTDNTAGVLAQATVGCPNFSVKVLREDRRGKSNALNRGLSAAQGEIILIVDDDVILHPQWLVKHVESYRLTSFDAMQGRILPGVDLNGRPANPDKLREYNIPMVDYGEEIRGCRGLTGSNISFKRDVFAKVGWFDARLGPGAAGFSEDTQYSLRIRDAGFAIGYTPHAVVYHELNPSRYGREYHRSVEYRKGVSRSVYRTDSILFRVLPNLAANCIRYAVYCFLGKTQRAYKTEGRIMKGWGYLAGKLRRRQFANFHSEN
jgi:glucosyl-dolichyl phosphate glucuronosyltransferase